MKEKVNKTNYYCFLVSLIGSKTVSTKEMRETIDVADKHFGIKPGGFQNTWRHYRVVTQNLLNILGDCMSSMEDTETKVRGRGKAMYYSIDKGLEEVCSIITEFYSSKDKKVVVEPKPVPVEKVKEEPEIRKKRLPNKKILLRVYRVVKRGLKAPLGYISFEDLKKEGGTKIKWKSWVSSLKDSGLTIPYTFEKGGILIGNVSGTIYSLTRKAKEWYGIELDTEKRSVIGAGLGIGMFAESMQLNPGLSKPAGTTTRKPIKVVDQPTHRSSIPQDKRDYVIYLISALIRRGGGRAVEIDTIGKFIRDNLGYSGVMKNDILDLIKEVGELTLVRSNSAISLRDPEKSWEVLKEKYSPSDCILVHARLGFSEEELRAFGFIGIEVESRISERDNIFAISIRRNSRKDFRKLVTLYQSFRGNDCILGNKSLVESLKTQAIEDQKFVKNNDPIYQLEKI